MSFFAPLPSRTYEEKHTHLETPLFRAIGRELRSHEVEIACVGVFPVPSRPSREDKGTFVSHHRSAVQVINADGAILTKILVPRQQKEDDDYNRDKRN